jgi:hypothetical protein
MMEPQGLDSSDSPILDRVRRNVIAFIWLAGSHLSAERAEFT